MTETTAIACAHVFKDERRVTVVVHHTDGVWQLVCGQHDHPSDCSDFVAVGLEHLSERQSNLEAIRDLPRGWMAEYIPGGWTRFAHDD